MPFSTLTIDTSMDLLQLLKMKKLFKYLVSDLEKSMFLLLVSECLF